MKSGDHEFEPWDVEGWSLSKGEVMSKSLVYQKGRRRKSSREGISETRGGQEVREVKSASGVAGPGRLSLWALGKELQGSLVGLDN